MMKLFRRSCAYGLCFVVLALAACSSEPPKVSLADAIRAIDKDMGHFQAISLMHVTKWSQTDRTTFANSMKAEQCRQGVDDPVIAFNDDKITIQVEGSFTDSKNFSVGSVTTAPALSLGGSHARMVDQKLLIPMIYTPMTQLPDKLFEQQIADYGHMPPDVQSGYITEAEENQAILQLQVNNIRDMYDPSFCKRVSNTTGQSMMFGAKATYLPKN